MRIVRIGSWEDEKMGRIMGRWENGKCEGLVKL